jgi:hypothetical protein
MARRYCEPLVHPSRTHVQDQSRQLPMALISFCRQCEDSDRQFQGAVVGPAIRNKPPQEKTQNSN